MSSRLPNRPQAEEIRAPLHDLKLAQLRNWLVIRPLRDCRPSDAEEVRDAGVAHFEQVAETRFREVKAHGASTLRVLRPLVKRSKRALDPVSAGGAKVAL